MSRINVICIYRCNKYSNCTTIDCQNVIAKSIFERKISRLNADCMEKVLIQVFNPPINDIIIHEDIPDSR